ncbi:MAG: DTW domain-containing protein [Gammaproteobacteria bacterium]|nr:MAG: DTW domain-containing protein [Gammaproteobacteria bacterium]
MNAVQRLYQQRKSISTKAFKARGFKVIRCEQCRVSQEYCICALKPKTTSNSGFVLLMYDTEVLKPSNTGRLIADIIPNTYAFLWSRTQVNDDLIALLNDPQWQPFIVFPSQYADESRQVFEDTLPALTNKKPLFIMLDGSWREAKKMFRKSPYLAKFPMVSFTPEGIDEISDQNGEVSSRYQIRKAMVNNQLATAEVAAKVLTMANENYNAQLLDLWFDVFNYRYQQSVCQNNKANAQAVANLQGFVKN